MVIFYIFLRNLAKLEWQRLFFLSVYSVMFPCWGCNVNVMLALLSTSCKAFWPDVLQLQCEAADLHLSKPSRIIQEKKKNSFKWIARSEISVHLHGNAWGLKSRHVVHFYPLHPSQTWRVDGEHISIHTTEVHTSGGRIQPLMPSANENLWEEVKCVCCRRKKKLPSSSQVAVWRSQSYSSP